MTHEDLQCVLGWRNHPLVRRHMYTRHPIEALLCARAWPPILWNPSVSNPWRSAVRPSALPLPAGACGAA